ncbi:MAG: hydrolase 2, exosortase A system-associated [Gammaproteobacteria bacterium]
MSPSAGAPPAQPAFLQSAGGAIFTLFYRPRSEHAKGKAVLMVPPFAEEMNKSRRMFALLARDLARLGYGVLLVDLFGTGDSEGEFLQARWEMWKEDIARCTQWLKVQGVGSLYLLGLRLGALLALDVAKDLALPLQRIVLWQPAISGSVTLTQFLRLRLAASMMDSKQEKETTQQLRRVLFQERAPLEVAGYELAPELASAIETLNLADLAAADLPPLDWFEVVAADGRPLPPASQRVTQLWQGKGLEVHIQTMAGEPFWSAPEVTVMPTLLAATAAIFKSE